MDTITLVGVVAVVGFIIVAVYLSMRAGQARTSQLKATAAQLKLTFAGEFAPASAAGATGNPEHAFAALRGAFGGSRRFNGTTQPRLWNWMRGDRDGGTLHLFDYFGGDNPRDISDTQTLACLERASWSLPSFILMPIPGRYVVPIARASRAIAGVISGADGHDVEITTPADPEFDHHYLLRGTDERAVRALFTDRVRAFFARHPGWMVEGGGTHLVLNRFSTEDVALYWRGAITNDPVGEISAAARAMKDGTLGEKLQARAGLPAAEWDGFLRDVLEVGALFPEASHP